MRASTIASLIMGGSLGWLFATHGVRYYEPEFYWLILPFILHSIAVELARREKP